MTRRILSEVIVMAYFESNIVVRTPLVNVSIGLRVWKDQSGKGIVAYHPEDPKSQEFLTREKNAMNASVAEKYGLRQAFVFEQEGYYYVPQEGTRNSERIAPVYTFWLERLAEKFERGQDIFESGGLGPCR